MAEALVLAGEVQDWLAEHQITRDLLEPGSPGRALVEAFVAGALLHELPALEEYTAMFAFIRVTERWVEGRGPIGRRVFDRAHNAKGLQFAF